MRSEFQDVFKDAYDHWIDDACSHRYHSSKSLALQVWQHQQSKVDEAEAKAQMCRDEKNHAINRWSAVCKERDELQKRVDAVKQLIKSYKDEEKELELKEWEQSTIYGRVAIELEQALKGGE